MKQFFHLYSFPKCTFLLVPFPSLSVVPQKIYFSIKIITCNNYDNNNPIYPSPSLNWFQTGLCLNWFRCKQVEAVSNTLYLNHLKYVV